MKSMLFAAATLAALALPAIAQDQNPKPGADGIPNVARRFLEGQHGIVAYEDADLLAVDVSLDELHHAGDDEEPRLVGALVLVSLNLGALWNVKDVFDR